MRYLLTLCFFSLYSLQIFLLSAVAEVIPVTLRQPLHVVQSFSGLDPAKQQGFLVSVTFRPQQVPPVGARVLLVSKYVAEASPHRGWAIGLRALDTSLRPEVYWRGANGEGGWFTFEKIELTIGRVYSLSLFAQGDNFLNLFFEELQNDDLRIYGPENKSSSFSGAAYYLGGYDISEITSPETSASLEIGSQKRGKSAFQGEIISVLISHPTAVPKAVEEVRTLVSGGPVSLFRRFYGADAIFSGMSPQFRADFPSPPWKNAEIN